MTDKNDNDDFESCDDNNTIDRALRCVTYIQ